MLSYNALLYLEAIRDFVAIRDAKLISRLEPFGKLEIYEK
jgi:hypothetical protein